LRAVVTDVFYTLFGLVAPRGNSLNNNFETLDMMRSVHDEHGWWGEHDPRSAGDKGKRFLRELCGPRDLWDIGPESLSSASGEFLPLVTFDRFAALAKSYNKKFIIVFQPHPCGQLNEKTLQALDDSLSLLKRKHLNLYVYPEELFEHWPREVFSGADHLYLGYERYSSLRLGRFVAAALGLPSKTTGDVSVPLPSPVVRADEKPVWQNGNIDERWHLQDVVASPAAGSSWRIVETAQRALHSLETRISGLIPDRYYLVAVSYEPIGDRIIDLSLRTAVKARAGATRCNPDGLEAMRRAGIYDGSMIVNADGSIVCWGIFKLTQDHAYLAIDLLSRTTRSWYQGDGRSGLLVRNISLYMRSSPDVVLGAEDVGR
jgi:hypothetical protein